MNAYALTWTGVLDWIKQHAPGNSFKMFPHQIQHPKDAGMTMALDVPLGQRTTYRMLVAGPPPRRLAAPRGHNQGSGVCVAELCKVSSCVVFEHDVTTALVGCCTRVSKTLQSSGVWARI